MTFPCRGRTDTWLLTEAQVAEWQATFKGVDVVDECSRALAWLRANPSKQKTARGMPRFLVAWLNREVVRMKGVKRDGAYFEPKGARPAANPTYAEAYEAARKKGHNPIESYRIAMKEIELDS